MFLLQETPPYNVNSPSAASNQPSDQRFDAEKGKTEEETGGEHVESPAKDLNKQFVMVPVAQPAEAAPPTSDDEKLKLLLDGLQSISPHALQILAAAAQNASQKLECDKLKASHPNRGVAVRSRQADSVAHHKKLFALTLGRSWTQNLEKQKQQSLICAKPTQQNPNPRPLHKRGQATHRLPLPLLSR